MKQITLTVDLIQQGKSKNGGWNGMQISVLGENQKVKGWYRRLVGKIVDEEKVVKFLELKDYHFRNQPNKIFKTKTAKVSRYLNL